MTSIARYGIRVWKGSLRPSDIMATADICLQQGSIRNRACLSIGVTSGTGAGLCGAPGGEHSGVSERGYTGSWICTSENTYSTHSGE
jgi:hypothetical protein